MTMAMGMITGLQASVTEHQPPAPLPEFKTPEQLAKWRTETTAKTSAQEASRPSTLDSSTPFYTGKPYLADSGSYAFKYREYNPEMGRWTTVDPSGFPDGANNRMYTAIPNSQLDAYGLFNSGKFIEGFSEFTLGVTSITGGSLMILNSGETLGLSGALGIIATLSGGIGITAGLADMGQGFADTDTWVPSSMGSFVGYSTGMLSGKSQQISEEFANVGALVEDMFLPSGIKVTLAKKLLDYSVIFSDASKTINGYRSLKAAVNSQGQHGYE